MRPALRSRVCRRDRATARHSCPSRFSGRDVRRRAECHHICRSSIGAVQRQALVHKPFAEIGAADRPGRDRPAIGVEAEGRTISRTPVRQGRLLPASWRAEKRERKRVGAPALSVNQTGPKPVPVPLPSRFYHRSSRPQLRAWARRKRTNTSARRFSRPMRRLWLARLRV